MGFKDGTRNIEAEDATALDTSGPSPCWKHDRRPDSTAPAARPAARFTGWV
jgi:hypothetical protein